VSRPAVLLVVLLAGLLGACGSSQKPVSGSANAAAPPSAASASMSTGSSATKHKPARRRSHGHSRSPAAGASNAQLPARYEIRQGGTLSPAVVAAPTAVTIALTVVSSDVRGHRVAVRSPRAAMLVVPAGGRASALLAGLKAGSYGVYVDGVRRGALVVGVAPGP
jgi:hypothetical protein